MSYIAFFLLVDQIFDERMKRLEYSEQDALKYVVSAGKQLLQLLEPYTSAAVSYVTMRDKHTERIQQVLDNMLAKLRLVPVNFELTFRVMSSFYAGTYLQGESDVDIGVLVPDLTLDKTNELIVLFANMGFTLLRKDDVIEDKRNTYVSMTLKTEGVDFELKLRDPNHIGGVMSMHVRLDNNVDVSTKILVTYGKYLFKTYNYDNIRTYNRFKVLIFEYLCGDMEGMYTLKTP
jgi:hypothetical protein